MAAAKGAATNARTVNTSETLSWSFCRPTREFRRITNRRLGIDERRSDPVAPKPFILAGGGSAVYGGGGERLNHPEADRKPRLFLKPETASDGRAVQPSTAMDIGPQVTAGSIRFAGSSPSSSDE